MARPNLVRYQEPCECGGTVYGVMDLANGGYYEVCFVCWRSEEGNDMEEEAGK